VQEEEEEEEEEEEGSTPEDLNTPQWSRSFLIDGLASLEWFGT
jgi:hypothetical protein